MPATLSRVMFAGARAQLRILRANVEDLRPVLTMPAVAVIAVAVLIQSGHRELAPYGLVAAVLMTVGQMGNFVASEIVFRERQEQILELAVASPSPYYAVLLARVLVLTTCGTVGALESWLLTRLVFDLEVTVYHPFVALLTLLASSMAAAGTALLTTALFALGSQVRTFQNALNGPLYLLGGVLVPTTLLPAWLQPLSPFVFYYWAARVLRTSLLSRAPENAARELSYVLLLGIATAALAQVVLARMLERLRRDGTLGLT